MIYSPAALSTMSLEELVKIAQHKLDNYELIEQELLQAILNKINKLHA